jgi:acetyltransferase-like isoleucine patch superfamily enzyme
MTTALMDGTSRPVLLLGAGGHAQVLSLGSGSITTVYLAAISCPPSAVLCGAVSVASESFIGAGSVTIQGVPIGQYGIVGADATLVKDLPAGHVVTSASVRIHESKYVSRPEKT